MSLSGRHLQLGAIECSRWPVSFDCKPLTLAQRLAYVKFQSEAVRGVAEL